MSKITYRNYVISKVDTKFNSNYVFTDLAKSRQNFETEIVYRVSLDYANIQRQARFFRKKFLAGGHLKNSFLNNVTRHNQIEDLIEKTYEYSYFKSLFYGLSHSLRREEMFTFSPTTRVFSGHKELFDTLVSKRLYDIDHFGASVSIRIIPDDILFKYLRDKVEIIKENIDEVGEFFNPIYENILVYFEDTLSDIIKVESLKPFNGPRLIESPVGNSCFLNDGNNIGIIEGIHTKVDKISYFWNIAVGITVIKNPEIDIDDALYDTILTSNYDPRNVKYEVYSITGYDTTGESSHNMNFDDGGGPLPPKNPNFPWRRENKIILMNNDNKGGKQNLRNRGKNKNITRELNDKLANLVNKGNVLSREDARLLATVISVSKNITFKDKTINDWVGQSVRNVLDKFKIGFRIDVSPDTTPAFLTERISANQRDDLLLLDVPKDI